GETAAAQFFHREVQHTETAQHGTEDPRGPLFVVFAGNAELMRSHPVQDALLAKHDVQLGPGLAVPLWRLAVLRAMPEMAEAAVLRIEHHGVVRYAEIKCHCIVG